MTGRHQGHPIDVLRLCGIRQRRWASNAVTRNHNFLSTLGPKLIDRSSNFKHGLLPIAFQVTLA